MATYLDAAGPTGAPAVVIHPDQELPKVWHVISTWTHDGLVGAWLERDPDWQRREIAQVVYGEAPIHRPGNLGVVLSGALDRLRCHSIVSCDVRIHCREAFNSDWRARRAYYADRGEDIARLDWHARQLYEANGKPTPDDGFGGTPTPPIDEVPAAEPTDDELLVKASLLGVAMQPLALHPDSELPAQLQRMTHNNADWLYESPDDWTPVEWTKDARIRDLRGGRSVVANWRRRQLRLIWEAEHANGGAVAVPTADPPPPPAGPPPEPGIGRAKWIGERITAMVARESSTYLPHTRRRIAAHRALSIVAGYEPQDAENDGLTLAGGFLLHLEGLNAYAARAFAGRED